MSSAENVIVAAQIDDVFVDLAGFDRFGFCKTFAEASAQNFIGDQQLLICHLSSAR